MEIVTLLAKLRGLEKSAKELRADRKIPAVYYGKGQKNLHLELDYQTFRKLFAQAGESTIIDLQVEGEKEPFKVLVQEVQYDPVKDTFSHVDFIHVVMTEAITTKVPLEFVGTALGVKDLGGNLTVSKNELEIKCLPLDLPHSIEVDISGLIDFSVVIHVKDVIVPDKVTVLDDIEGTVVSVSAPREEKEEELEEEEEEGEEGAEAEEGEEKKEDGDKKEGEEGKGGEKEGDSKGSSEGK